jgi:hypothetical protein
VAACRLLAIGVVLVALMVIVHLVTEVGSHIGDRMIPAVVFAVGVLGAFFSRVTTFQTNSAALRFEAITADFHKRVLYVRLLYGGIGAVVFYYILRSGLAHTHFLPDWAVLDTRCHPSEVPAENFRLHLRLNCRSCFSGRSLQDFPSDLFRAHWTKSALSSFGQ